MREVAADHPIRVMTLVAAARYVERPGRGSWPV
jgi:hypothetical protein